MIAIVAILTGALVVTVVTVVVGGAWVIHDLREERWQLLSLIASRSPAEFERHQRAVARRTTHIPARGGGYAPDVPADAFAPRHGHDDRFDEPGLVGVGNN